MCVHVVTLCVCVCAATMVWIIGMADHNGKKKKKSDQKDKDVPQQRPHRTDATNAGTILLHCVCGLYNSDCV